MKRLGLVFVLFALTLGLSAQNNLINFGDLPGLDVPAPVPTLYENYTWSGMYYVNPWVWPGAGPGFKHQEFVRNSSVAFIPYVCVSTLCYASISSPTGFMLQGAHVAAGYAPMGPAPSTLFVIAYNNGKYVGSATYELTTNVRSVVFPPEWGAVTQVMFKGDAVFFDLNVYGVSTPKPPKG